MHGWLDLHLLVVEFILLEKKAEIRSNKKIYIGMGVISHAFFRRFYKPYYRRHFFHEIHINKGGFKNGREQCRSNGN